MVGSRLELQEIMGETPLEFVTNFVNRFNEVRDLNIPLVEGFEKAREYFLEAKKCYATGALKGSVVLAVSALEICLRTDYARRESKEWKKSLAELLAFYLQQKWLPSSYERISSVVRQLRNEMVHCGVETELAFDKTLVMGHFALTTKIINHLMMKTH